MFWFSRRGQALARQCEDEFASAISGLNAVRGTGVGGIEALRQQIRSIQTEVHVREGAIQTSPPEPDQEFDVMVEEPETSPALRRRSREAWSPKHRGLPMPDQSKPSFPAQDSSHDLRPSSGLSRGATQAQKEKTLSLPPGSRSSASTDGDELQQRKKDLVEAFDKIVDPLQRILTLMERHQTSVALVIVVLILNVGGMVYATMRLSKIEEDLNTVVTAQVELQKTAAATASAVGSAAQIAASQSHVTLESVTDTSGAPTAVVVLTPPAAKKMAPVVLPLTSLPRPAPRAVASSAPAAPAPSSITFRVETRQP